MRFIQHNRKVILAYNVLIELKSMLHTLRTTIEYISLKSLNFVTKWHPTRIQISAQITSLQDERVLCRFAIMAFQDLTAIIIKEVNETKDTRNALTTPKNTIYIQPRNRRQEAAAKEIVLRRAVQKSVGRRPAGRGPNRLYQQHEHGS